MTDQEKIYRIAEFCGAKWIRLAKQVGEKIEKRSLIMPDDPVLNMYDCTPADGSEQICQIHALPNYLSDLNAMHKAEIWAEEHSNAIFANDYPRALAIVILGHDCNQCLDPFVFVDKYNFIHATAEQRADAFLKTIEDND